MGNYDQMAAAVSELSGGKNVVLLDDIGMPSIYVRIPKGKNSELVSGLSDNVHYAFNVDSVEKTAFYYSKYQNIIVNERAYSLGHRDPANSINWDAARKACENKGAGFHLASSGGRERPGTLCGHRESRAGLGGLFSPLCAGGHSVCRRRKWCGRDRRTSCAGASLSDGQGGLSYGSQTNGRQRGAGGICS